jgi:predicted dehydrogenase
MMGTLKVAVIGCGSIAEIAHFPAIAENPELELVAVCDVDEKRARETARKRKAKAWHLDYKELLAEEKLDLVVIATPPVFHWEQGLAAARAGVHALIEKPLAGTNMEAWDIVDAFRKSQKKLMVGCDRRYWFQSEWAKDLVDKGVIGKVMLGRSTMHEGWNLYQGKLAVTDFRKKPELAAGAALWDTGAHAIDLLVWLLGSPVKRVVGIAERLATPASYSECDDVALVLMEHENHAFGYVSCNRYSPAASHFAELYGDHGTIFLGSDSLNPYQTTPLAVFTDRDYEYHELPEIIRKYRWPHLFWAEDLVTHPVEKRWVSIVPPREPNDYQRLWRHLIDCILNDKTPLTKGEDGAHAVEVMCAVFKSMETRGWVDLPLTEEVSPPGYQSQRSKSRGGPQRGAK